MTDFDAFLESLELQFERYEHPAVFTCDEARQWVPSMSAAETKNLFLRDDKGRRYFLVVVSYDKSVELKALAPLLGVKKLLLGSPERLLTTLGVTPGSVTILALFHDVEHAVELVLDRDIADAEALRCHPLVNTATLAIVHSEIRRFLAATGHAVTVLDVPSRRS